MMIKIGLFQLESRSAASTAFELLIRHHPKMIGTFVLVSSLPPQMPIEMPGISMAEIGLVKPLEEMISDTCSRPPPLTDQRRTRPPKEQALNCPRCNSLNTKFCYYNNYSLTQPRYFCKTCRRYWTEGGSLRNVPVGGGSRKNKRPSSSSSAKKSPDLISQNPKENNFHQGHDLNLSFHTTQEYPNMAEFVELQGIQNSNSNNHNHNNNSSDVTTTATTTTTSLSALELLRSGISSRGLNSFMPMPMAESNPVYASRFGLHDQFRPSLNFPVEGLGGAFGDVQGEDQETSGRLLFPFEDLKPVTNPNFEQQNRGQGESPGYWTGMLGGGFL